MVCFGTGELWDCDRLRMLTELAIKYWHTGQFCANYLHKTDLIYVGANSKTLRSIQ